MLIWLSRQNTLLLAVDQARQTSCFKLQISLIEYLTAVKTISRKICLSKSSPNHCFYLFCVMTVHVTYKTLCFFFQHSIKLGKYFFPFTEHHQLSESLTFLFLKMIISSCRLPCWSAAPVPHQVFSNLCSMANGYFLHYQFGIVIYWIKTI